MRVWEFEPYLVGALNAVAGVTATSFRAAEVMLPYGVVARSTSGASARIRLTASGDQVHDRPDGHVENLARIEGHEERAATIDAGLAAKVECLLDRVVNVNPPADLLHVMTFRDRRTALKLRIDNCGYGVVVTFTSGFEVFAAVTG